MLDVIVDSSGYENIFRKLVVQKLKLLIEKHLSLYIIKWIKDANEIGVMDRWREPITISKYHDWVYCDFVDMDACHLM